MSKEKTLISTLGGSAVVALGLALYPGDVTGLSAWVGILVGAIIV